MGFRCESELPISSSPDTLELTWHGHKVGMALAKGAGAQSIPKAQLAGQDMVSASSQHVCGMVRATRATSQASAPTLVPRAELPSWQQPCSASQV